MKITCGHCGEAFDIGEDAFLVIDEDKFQNLVKAEAQVLILGQLSRKPDMVMHWTRPASASEREVERQKAEAIAQSLARGGKRQWWCGKCYNETPNPYPEV